MISECIIIWPLNIYIRGPVHEFMHVWGPASLARGRGHGWLASLPAGQTPGQGDNLHISLLLYSIYTGWPDYYASIDHNNLSTQYIKPIEESLKNNLIFYFYYYAPETFGRYSYI